MKTPETPKHSAERTNEEPKSLDEVIMMAKRAGEGLNSLKKTEASAEELKAAEQEAQRWLAVAMAGKLANTIDSDRPEPPRYERVGEAMA